MANIFQLQFEKNSNQNELKALYTLNSELHEQLIRLLAEPAKQKELEKEPNAPQNVEQTEGTIKPNEPIPTPSQVTEEVVQTQPIAEHDKSSEIENVVCIFQKKKYFK